MKPDALPPASRHEVDDGDTRITLLVITVPAPPPAEEPPAPVFPLPVRLGWRGNRRVDLYRP